MKAGTPALILYFTACVATVLSAYFDSDMLMTFTKPVIIPSILFYYLSTKRYQFDWLYAFVLLMTFVGDTIVLMHFDNEILLIMGPYIISYLGLLVLFAQDVAKLPFRRSSFAIGFGVFLAIVLVAFSLNQMMHASQTNLHIPILAYGGILGFQAGLASYYYSASSTNMSFYMAMTALFNCVSDIFYVIFTLIIHIEHYLVADLALQVFSYYFLIKYFIFRKI